MQTPRNSYARLTILNSHSISTIISFFSHIFGASLDFLIAAWGALPLPVIVGLAYRIGA